MSEFIGVSHLKNHIPTKRDLLFFDKIAIPTLDNFLPEISNSSVVSDLEWLQQQGVIFNTRYGRKEGERSEGDYIRFLTETPSLLITGSLSMFIEDPRFMDEYKEDPVSFIDIILKKWAGIDNDKVRNSMRSYVIEELNKYIIEFERHGTKGLKGKLDIVKYNSHESVVRITALGLRENYALDAVPLLVRHHDYVFPPMIKSNYNDVMSIVIKKLPTPDDSTPLEQVLDYKNDPNSKTHILRLRKWMRKLSKDNLAPIEIEQELEYLISEYETHMKLNKMKINNTALETTLTMTAEVAENIVKIKWKDAMKSLFTFKHRKIALIEAEKNAMGREVAYIVKTNNEF